MKDAWALVFEVLLAYALGFLLVACLLAAVGCGPTTWPADVRSASDRWAAACGRRPTPEAVTVVDAPRVRCGSVPRAVGCTTGRRDVVVTATAGESVLLHELGHVLGARHLRPGQWGVMASGADAANWLPCLTQDDIDAVGDCPAPHPECSHAPADADAGD